MRLSGPVFGYQMALFSVITHTREAGRAQVYAVLEVGASGLAAFDQGVTAWQAFQAIQEVEDWWE